MFVLRQFFADALGRGHLGRSFRKIIKKIQLNSAIVPSTDTIAIVHWSKPSRVFTLDGLVFGVTQIFDRTLGAFRPDRRTLGAAVMDQQMSKLDPPFAR